MKHIIDAVLFTIFIGGMIVYYNTHNDTFLALSIIAVIVLHGIHQQEVIDEKTELMNDIIKLFKKKDKSE